MPLAKFLRSPGGARRARAGLTMLELLLSFTVLSMLLGSVLAVTASSSVAHRSHVDVAQLEAKARRTLDRLATELQAAGLGGLSPKPQTPFHSDNLAFEISVGYANGGVVWGSGRRVELRIEPSELADGFDNDGDGLVDEGEVVLTHDVTLPTEEETVLVRGVARLLEGELPNGADDNGNGLLDEPGLAFDLLNDTLRIRLTLEGVDSDGRHLVVTRETAVKPRNE